MANFLTSYLVTSPFDNTRSSEDIISQAQTGYYSLQDYAVQHWYHHAQALADMAENSDTHEGTHIDLHLRDAACSLQQFVHFYAKPHLPRVDTIGSQESLSAILAQVPHDEHERTAYLNLELRTTWIRNEIESLEGLGDSQKEVLDDLHGPFDLFKCHKPWCSRFANGFSTLEERTSHMDRHDRPFQCQHEDCLWSSFGVETEADLDAHYSRYHATEDIQFPKSIRKTVSRLPSILQAAKDGDITSVKTYLDNGDKGLAQEVYRHLFGTPRTTATTKFANF